jgi:hypothetical protein
MTLVLDLGAKPAPIEVEFAGGSFRLIHVYMTAEERGQAVESISRFGIAAAFALFENKVINWEGVQQPGGSPIPLNVAGDNGGMKSNLGVVFGRIPFMVQVETILIWFAMNGVKFAGLRASVQTFIDDASEVTRIEERVTSFFNSRGATDGTSSAASSAIETSPTKSA